MNLLKKFFASEDEKLDAKVNEKIAEAFGADGLKHASGLGECANIYAWVCTHPDGSETVPAIIKSAKGVPTAIPLMTTRLDQARGNLKDWATEIHETSGMPLALVRFERVEVKEEMK